MRNRVGPFSIKELLEQKDAAAEPKAEPPPPQQPGVSSAEPAAETLPSLDELSPLPLPGSPYVAAARAANKPVPSLVILQANASARGFPYSNLEAFDLLPGEAGQGPIIALTFSGVVAREVRIAGRNLRTLYSRIGQHRVGWIREVPPDRDFLPEEETVITRISVEKVKEDR